MSIIRELFETELLVNNSVTVFVKMKCIYK